MHKNNLIMDKVTKLFPLLGLDYKNKDDRKFFSELTDLGVIAGGSIVYALRNSIRRRVVGDIDLYILSNSDVQIEDVDWSVIDPKNSLPDAQLGDLRYNLYYTDLTTFTKVIKLLLSRLIDPVVTVMDNEDYVFVTPIPLIQMIKSKNAKPIQIILLRHRNTVMSFIERFDFSYVKCAFHKNKVWMTDDAIESHETGIVQLKQEDNKKTRLDKMIKKGFELSCEMPYYINSTDVDEECLINPDMKKFKRSYNEHPSDLFYIHPDYKKEQPILIKCIKHIVVALGYGRYHVSYPNLNNRYHTFLLLQTNPLGTRDLNLLLADFCNGNDTEYMSDYLDTFLQKRCTVMCQALDDIYVKNEHAIQANIDMDARLGLYKTLRLLSNFIDVIKICRMSDIIRKVCVNLQNIYSLSDACVEYYLNILS